MKYHLIVFAFFCFTNHIVNAKARKDVILFANSTVNFIKSEMNKGQQSGDTNIMVSQQLFDSLLVSAISILSDRKFIEIKESDHVNIIRLINTIHYNHLSIPQYEIDEKFMKIVIKKEYEQQLANHYHWIPNKGMGMFFPELKVELGGTPNAKSIYTLSISSSPQGGDRE